MLMNRVSVFLVLVTDTIIQDFNLHSVVMRPYISFFYMFSFFHVSQHVTANNMSMLLLLVQDHKATLCQVENLPNDVSLDSV